MLERISNSEELKYVHISECRVSNKHASSHTERLPQAIAPDNLKHGFTMKSEMDKQVFGGLEVSSLEKTSKLHEPILGSGGKAEHFSFSVIGSVVPVTPVPISIITYIKLVAAEGKAEKLENLLSIGSKRVIATEPETYQWYALKDLRRASHYALLDLYADEQGLAKHLKGEVAATLKANAGELVLGGWKAIVSQAQNFSVLNQV